MGFLIRYRVMIECSIQTAHQRGHKRWFLSLRIKNVFRNSLYLDFKSQWNNIKVFFFSDSEWKWIEYWDLVLNKRIMKSQNIVCLWPIFHRNQVKVEQCTWLQTLKEDFITLLWNRGTEHLMITSKIYWYLFNHHKVTKFDDDHICTRLLWFSSILQLPESPSVVRSHLLLTENVFNRSLMH